MYQHDQTSQASLHRVRPTESTPGRPAIELEGKVAFVTGGDSGIGLGIARACLNAGMKVVITYRTRAHLDEAMQVLSGYGRRLHAVSLDVTNRSQFAAAADETEQVFGKVHVLVNNAGVAPLVPLCSATFDDWDWCMDVNVTGIFNGVRTFLPRIRAHNEGGHIVATSSMLGGLVVGPFWGVYSSSKFAVVGMMEALRSELATTNIGVSVFCPAAVFSHLDSCERNRPATLGNTGANEPSARETISGFRSALESALKRTSDSKAALDPVEVGEVVLRGIQNNDLYILSHPEYEQAIRERSEALLASVPVNKAAPTAGRLAIANLAHTSIYTDETAKRRLRRRSDQ